MGLVEKLKLLIKVKKPVGDILIAAEEAKKSKKWFHFAVTVIGTLGSTVAALSGVIPPQAQIIVATILQSLYNILRGADKADKAEIKGTLRTTEFWLTALSEIQKSIVVVQGGWVNPEWLAASATVVGMALAAGQNLAARAPDPAKN